MGKKDIESNEQTGTWMMKDFCTEGFRDFKRVVETCCKSFNEIHFS